MKEPEFVVCAAVGASVLVDSYARQSGGQKRPCHDCGVDTWRSPSTQQLPKPSLCHSCVHKRYRRQNVAFVITPESKEALDRMNESMTDLN